LSIVGGILLPEVDNLEQRAFFGLGFGIEGVPIDVVPIFQLGNLFSDLSLLVVDEFLKMNGVDDRLVFLAREQLINALEALGTVYGEHPDVQLCSGFMHKEAYFDVYTEVKEAIVKDPALLQIVSDIVPESKRHLPTAKEYPFHELACIKYLADNGFVLKIGPSKEQEYVLPLDQLGISMDSAYLLDAYPVGAKDPEPIVHYAPKSRGKNNGQRIFLHESEEKVRAKLLGGSETALRYFCRIASVSGRLLGQEYLEQEEIDSLRRRRLKGRAIKLVLENIIRPYQEVRK